MNNAVVTPLPVLDALYGALFRPRETFLEHQAPMRAAGFAVLLVAFVSACDMAKGDGSLLGLALVTALAALIFYWLLMAAGLFFTTRAFYQRGEFFPIAASLGLASIPWILLAPLHVVSRLGPHGEQVAAVGYVLLFMWWLRLALLSLRGAANLNGGQALWSLVAMELLALALPFVAITLFGLMLVMAVAQSV